MYEITFKMAGHGYELTGNVGPFEKEPAERVVVNAKEGLEQFFHDMTGRPVMTSVAYTSTASDHQVAGG
jgi:hypothetical protein